MLYYVKFPENYKHVSNFIIPDPDISKHKSVLLEIYFNETETETLFESK